MVLVKVDIQINIQNKVVFYLILYTQTHTHIQINPKWIKDLTIRSKVTKLLEENTVDQLFDIYHGNDFFFYVTPKTSTMKVRIKQAGLHQTEKLLHKQ